MQPSYRYAAKVLSIHDGDTLTANIDVGFRMSYTTPLRFDNIDAPELKTAAGKSARDFLKTLVKVGDQIVIETSKDPVDKYGRWLAMLYLPNGICINEAMVINKHAVYYDGGKKTI